MSVKIIRGKRDMPELSVDTKELFEAAEEMKKLLYQCDSVTQELDQVISCFHYQINSDGYDREVNGLITQSTNLKSTRENLASAANTLQQIAECYEKVASYTNIVDMYVSDFKDNYIENFFPEVRDAILGNLLKGMKELARIINISTVTVQSEGENAFLILDPKTLSKTEVLSKYGAAVSKTLGVLIPVVGTVMDFISLKKAGESTEDAFIKANVHTVIGIAGGKVGTVIGTCVASKFAHSETTGIVAGTVMGIPIGLIITTWGDMKFDKWYEEQKEQWEEKKEREQEINPYVILE